MALGFGTGLGTDDLSGAIGSWGRMADLDETIRGNLARFPRTEAVAAGLRRAGVVITVHPWREEAHVLVLKRSFAGRNAGQWALPGGRLEPGEGPVEGALRELAEEVGLVVRPEQVAGRLDDFVTGSGFVISPVVVVLRDGVRPRRDPHEVHSLHPVPLRRLVDPELPRWRRTPEGALLQMPLRHDMVIHAPTGALLWQFREVALLGRATRVTRVTQPEWTHV